MSGDNERADREQIFNEILNEMLADTGLSITVRRWLPGDEADKDENRQRLVARARELGVYDAPEERTDQELADAIAAEEAAGEWLDRLEALPTDEEKRAAVARLAEEFRRQS